MKSIRFYLVVLPLVLTCCNPPRELRKPIMEGAKGWWIRSILCRVTGRLQVGVLFAIGAGRQAGDPFEKFAEHRL